MVFSGKVRLIRFNRDGSMDQRLFRYSENNKRGSFHNPYLRNGDLIFIGKSALNVTNEVIDQFFSPFLKLYTPYLILRDVSK